MLLQLDPHSSNQKHIIYNDLMFLKALVPDPVSFFFFFFPFFYNLLQRKGKGYRPKPAHGRSI